MIFASGVSVLRRGRRQRLELRQVGSQFYTLELVLSGDISPVTWKPIDILELHHVDAAGQERHRLTFERRAPIPDAPTAWNLAAEHSYACEVSGNCNGEIAVRFKFGGQVHKGWHDRNILACGRQLASGSLDHRVPGLARDYPDEQICSQCWPYR